MRARSQPSPARVAQHPPAPCPLRLQRRSRLQVRRPDPTFVWEPLPAAGAERTGANDYCHDRTGRARSVAHHRVVAERFSDRAATWVRAHRWAAGGSWNCGRRRGNCHRPARLAEDDRPCHPTRILTVCLQWTLILSRPNMVTTTTQEFTNSLLDTSRSPPRPSCRG